ncbi:GNAT family N-acetyltransferase [Paenochrobactrum sp. BZR 588]|uniref:GNAT family N-acetyltransferase n=1 Tax=Paenochrobactrum TaxID=999488 RepID=UPI0035BBFE42
MKQTELTYVQENAAHNQQIEDINAEAFGPGRFTRAAHFIREGGPHDEGLSFVALDGDRVIASVRLTRVTIGSTPAVMLGPLAVRPEFKNRGIGRHLMQMSMDASKAVGDKLIVLVGDEPYYGPFGFKMIKPGSVTMPAPVDPRRLLACELQEGAMEGVSGMMRYAGQAAPALVLKKAS